MTVNAFMESILPHYKEYVEATCQKVNLWSALPCRRMNFVCMQQVEFNTKYLSL